MDIKSSALDLTASGVHSFDNQVDYRLGLYLSQILGKKVRNQNSEFGSIEDDGFGRPRIFLTMRGSASDPKFAFDRKGVEKKITDEINKEKKILKNILKDEFGSIKKQDNKNTTPKKTEELQIDFDED
jgi:hypothetical protein